jgi:benzodiazapine receptor
MKLKRNDWISLAMAVLLPQLAGGLGALATASSVNTWYRGLKKPAWNPPGWLFGPVWTVLYLLMGFASWLIWRQGTERATELVTGTAESANNGTGPRLALPQEPETRQALALYAGQLALNTLWSLIFFGVRSLGGALAEIGTLWALIVLTAVRFFRLKPAAGWLLIPYLAWSTFAAVLNGAIWRLNRE